MKSITDNFELLEKRTRFSRSDLIGAQEILENFSEYKISELDSIALKTAKGLRIAIDFVPKTIKEIKEELRAEAEQAEREMKEAKKSLQLEYK